MAKYVNDTVAQKIANDIQKNRVNLGAFDTVDTVSSNTCNTIYRWTYYIKLESLEWDATTLGGNSCWKALCPSEIETYEDDELPNVKSPNFEAKSIDDISAGATNCIGIRKSDGYIYVNNDEPSITPEGLLQAKLKVIYRITENIIKGVPIHTLDQNGEEWLRSEWEKGLNLWDEKWSNGYYAPETGNFVASNNHICSANQIPVKPNTVYYTTQVGGYVCFYTLSGQFISSYDNQTNTFTTPNNCAYIKFNCGSSYGSTYNNDIMIVEGDHPYPYQPYSGAIVREKDIENVAYVDVGNVFTAKQTIRSSSDTPLDVNTTSYGEEIYVGFYNGVGTRGWLGINSFKPYFFTANSGVKPSGYLLTDNDIAELKALVYDNLYPAIESVDTTYSFNYTLPSSLNSNLTIFGAGMDISEVKGRSYVYNQLLNDTYSYPSTRYGYTVSKNGDIIHVTGTGETQGYQALQTLGYDAIDGHYYLFIVNPRGTAQGQEGTWQIYAEGVVVKYQIESNTIKQATSSGRSSLNVAVYGGQLDVYYMLKVVDLTKWFNGAIPSDLLSNPSLFLTKYYNGSLDYDTGTLIDSKLVSITSKGMNIFDEQVETGKMLNSATGELYNETNGYVSSFVRIRPSTTYYIKLPENTGYYRLCFYDKNQAYLGSDLSVVKGGSGDFTTPSDAYYVRFGNDNATYNHDICINISNSSVNGTYQPHIQDTIVPLANPIALKSAGSVQDTNSEKLVGSVDLGTLEWYYDATFGFYVPISNLKNMGASICSKYTTSAVAYDGLSDKELTTNNAGLGGSVIVVKDSAYTDPTTFKQAMSGVYLNYELATPVAQQLILPQNINIQKGGSIEFNYDNGTPSDIELQFAVSKAGN